MRIVFETGSRAPYATLWHGAELIEVLDDPALVALSDAPPPPRLTLRPPGRLRLDKQVNGDSPEAGL